MAEWPASTPLLLSAWRQQEKGPPLGNGVQWGRQPPRSETTPPSSDFHRSQSLMFSIEKLYTDRC